jgi:hypothetical protein
MQQGPLMYFKEHFLEAACAHTVLQWLVMAAGLQAAAFRTRRMRGPDAALQAPPPPRPLPAAPSCADAGRLHALDAPDWLRVGPPTLDHILLGSPTRPPQASSSSAATLHAAPAASATGGAERGAPAAGPAAQAAGSPALGKRFGRAARSGKAPASQKQAARWVGG